MHYAVVCFPSINSPELQEFRQKFDPKAELIPPHITLVFPVPGDIDQKALEEHIKRVVLTTKPFTITLKGTDLASDHYLYLLVSNGHEEIIALHDRLYTDILAPFLRSDIPFVPHLTIGYFDQQGALDTNTHRAAQQALASHPLEFDVQFDHVNLIQIRDQASPREIVKRFAL